MCSSYITILQNKCEREKANETFTLYKLVICELLPAYSSSAHFQSVGLTATSLIRDDSLMRDCIER